MNGWTGFGSVATAVILLVLATAGNALGHCDTLDGPVVNLARQALAKGDVKIVLPWVAADKEAEIRKAFDLAVAVRGKGEKERELADTYFFETLVRVHRAGEGAPYTGLKPAGLDPGPAGAFAERFRFSTYLVFCLLWSLLVYNPVAHWMWGIGGWLRNLGAIDFAGGTVVHITAGVYVNDAEDGLIADIDEWLEKLAPSYLDYRHHQTGERNGDAHLKSLLVHHEVIVPITGGALDLGPWQQIYYAEFDGRRRKRVVVKALGL